MIGFFLYIIIMIPTIGMMLFGVGEFIVARLSPKSWFVKWWRTYIVSEDPDDK